MLDAVRRGDRVVTGGGIIGTVREVGADDEVQVEIAEGVRVRCLRSTISTVLAKTEPAKGGGAGGKTDAATNPAAPAETPKTGIASIGKMFGRK